MLSGLGVGLLILLLDWFDCLRLHDYLGYLVSCCLVDFGLVMVA